VKTKVKYQGGATKKICMWLASAERKKFSKQLWSEKLRISCKNFHPDFDIISFSGIKDFEEQALSIYSFLFHAGTPRKWTVYSDGSYTSKEKEFLLKKFNFLEVKEWNHNKELENNELLSSYLKVCPLSKKLRVVLGHEYERQTIYVDSDIVFYKNSFAYFNSNLLQKGLWYLADTNWGTIPSTGLNNDEHMFELNSGVMILNREFSLDPTWEYLKNLNFQYEYFSEQSSFNFSFKKQNATVLDPRQFIVDTEDQFDFSMSYESYTIALRHYVNPVRHKMWQKGWKWHFKN
jgi:hypothetical protein